MENISKEKREALALLYVQLHATVDTSPEEMVDIYFKALNDVAKEENRLLDAVSNML